MIDLQVAVVDRTKLRHAPTIVQRHTKDFVREATLITERAIEDRTPVVTGRTKRAWHTTMTDAYTARIENNLPHTAGLDRGYWIRRGRRVNRRKGPADMVRKGRADAAGRIAKLAEDTGGRIAADLT